MKLSKEEHREHREVSCCVMNCQAKIPIEKAIVIKDKYFCPLCGVAFYRSKLNL